MRSYPDLEDRVVAFYLRHNPDRLQVELDHATAATTRTELRDWAAGFIRQWDTEPQLWAALRQRYGVPAPAVKHHGVAENDPLAHPLLLASPPHSSPTAKQKKARDLNLLAVQPATLTITPAKQGAHAPPAPKGKPTAAAPTTPAKGNAVMTDMLAEPNCDLFSPILHDPVEEYPPALGIPMEELGVDVRKNGGRMASTHLLELDTIVNADARFDALDTGKPPKTDLLSDFGWWLPGEAAMGRGLAEKRAGVTELTWVEDALAYAPVPVDDGLRNDMHGFEGQLARSIARRDLIVKELIDKITQQKQRMKDLKHEYDLMLARLVRAREEYERVRKFKPLLPERFSVSSMQVLGWKAIAADATTLTDSVGSPRGGSGDGGKGEPPDPHNTNIVQYLKAKAKTAPPAKHPAAGGLGMGGAVKKAAALQDVLFLVDITTAPPYAPTRQRGCNVEEADDDEEMEDLGLSTRSGSPKTKRPYKNLSFVGDRSGAVGESLVSVEWSSPKPPGASALKRPPVAKKERAQRGAAAVAAALALLTILTNKTTTRFKMLTFPVTASVTATLGVPCYEKPHDTSAKKLTTFQANTKLVLLEIDGQYARVGHPEPRGWVPLKSTSGAPQVDVKEDPTFANIFKPPGADVRSSDADADQPTLPCKGVVKAAKGTVARSGHATSSDEVQRLAAATAVEVVEIKGRRARITSPCAGWVSLSNAAGTVLVELQPEEKKEDTPKDVPEEHPWWEAYNDPQQLKAEVEEQLRTSTDGDVGPPETTPEVAVSIVAGSAPGLAPKAECVPLEVGTSLWEEMDKLGYVLPYPDITEYRGGPVPNRVAALDRVGKLPPDEKPPTRKKSTPDRRQSMIGGKRKDPNKFSFTLPPVFERAYFVRVPLDPFDAHGGDAGKKGKNSPERSRLKLQLSITAKLPDTVMYVLYHRPPEVFVKDDKEEGEHAPVPPEYDPPGWLKTGFHKLPQYEVSYAWKGREPRSVDDEGSDGGGSPQRGSKKRDSPSPKKKQSKGKKKRSQAKARAGVGADDKAAGETLVRIPFDVYKINQPCQPGATMNLTYEYVPPEERLAVKPYPGTSKKILPPHPTTFIAVFTDKYCADPKKLEKDDKPKEPKWRADKLRMPCFQPGARVVVPRAKWHPGQLLKQIKDPQDPLDGMWQVLMDRNNPKRDRCLRFYSTAELKPWFTQTKRLYVGAPDVLAEESVDLQGMEMDMEGARDRQVLMTVVALDAKSIRGGGDGDVLAWGQTSLSPQDFFKDRDHSVSCELRMPPKHEKLAKFTAETTVPDDPPDLPPMKEPPAFEAVSGPGEGRCLCRATVEVLGKEKKMKVLAKDAMVMVESVTEDSNGRVTADIVKPVKGKVRVTTKTGRVVIAKPQKAKGASEKEKRRKMLKHRLDYREVCWLHHKDRLKERMEVVKAAIRFSEKHLAQSRYVKADNMGAQLPLSGLRLKLDLHNAGELQELPDFTMPIPDDAPVEDVEAELAKIRSEIDAAQAALELMVQPPSDKPQSRPTSMSVTAPLPVDLVSLSARAAGRSPAAPLLAVTRPPEDNAPHAARAVGKPAAARPSLLSAVPPGKGGAGAGGKKNTLKVVDL